MEEPEEDLQKYLTGCQKLPWLGEYDRQGHTPLVIPDLYEK